MKNVVNYWLFLHLLGVSKCLKCLKFRVMNNKEFSKTEHDDQTLVTFNFSSLSTLVTYNFSSLSTLVTLH